MKKILSIVKNKLKDRIAEQKRKYAHRYSIEEKEKIEHERLRQIENIRAGLDQIQDLRVFGFDTVGNDPILKGRVGSTKLAKK